MHKPNDRIGPYVLVRRLGTGAFGIVWLAERRTAITTTQFALKLPRDAEVDIERVRKEATVWVKASGHPNVLPIIEADVYIRRGMLRLIGLCLLSKHGLEIPFLHRRSKLLLLERC